MQTIEDFRVEAVRFIDGARRAGLACDDFGAAGAISLARRLDALSPLASATGPAGRDTDRFLYSPGMRIAGGSSEIQRNIIGERALGLPREPRPASSS